MILSLPLADGKLASFVRVLFRVFLAAVFLYAGGSKLRESPGMFADSIASFRLLAPSLIVPLALALPPFEIFVGCVLLVGYPLRLGPFCAFWMTTLFLVALALALLRSVRVDCGCFGSGPGMFSLSAVQRVWFDVVRDIIFAVISLVLYRQELRGGKL